MGPIQSPHGSNLKHVEMRAGITGGKDLVHDRRQAVVVWGFSVAGIISIGWNRLHLVLGGLRRFQGQQHLLVKSVCLRMLLLLLLLSRFAIVIVILWVTLTDHAHITLVHNCVNRRNVTKNNLQSIHTCASLTDRASKGFTIQQRKGYVAFGRRCGSTTYSRYIGRTLESITTKAECTLESG